MAAGIRQPDGAPLGRGHRPGLVCSTFATLLIVPSVFAVVMGNASISRRRHRTIRKALRSGPRELRGNHAAMLKTHEGEDPARKVTQKCPWIHWRTYDAPTSSSSAGQPSGARVDAAASVGR